METLAGLLGIAGLALALWAIVFAIRRIRRWNRAVTTGVLLRLGAGTFVFILAGVLAPPVPPSQPTAGQGKPQPNASAQPAGSSSRETAPPSTRPVPDREVGPTSARPPREGDRTRSPGPQPRKRPAKPGYAILDVVDGDTVDVAYRGQTTIRVIGIDTPEVYGGTECFGRAASSRAERLLSGRSVTLTFDPTQGRTDTYGRTLAYIGVDGTDFGLAMLRSGHAAEYTYDEPYRRQAAYQRADAAAQSRHSGQWGACGSPRGTGHAPRPERPTDPQARHQDPPAGDGRLPAPPPDLDCSDVDGPVRVGPGDPHGLDADGDGTGCDS